MREKGNRALPLPLRVIATFITTLEIIRAQNCTEWHLTSPMYYKMFPDMELSDKGLNITLHQTSCDSAVDLSDRLVAITGDRCISVPHKSSDEEGSKLLSLVNQMLVSNTKMKRLKAGSFESWTQIEELQITLNSELTEIEPGAFDGLFKVWNLSISDNVKLKRLSSDAFRGLSTLQQVRFLRNGISSVRDVTPALYPGLLPNVSYLDFSGNSIQSIEKEDFAPMNGSVLNTLFVSMTKTSYVHPEALNPLCQLRNVNFNINYINNTVCSALINSFKHVAPYWYGLALQKNLMFSNSQMVFTAIADSNITYLNIKENHFPRLFPGFFSSMPNLNELDISKNFIDDLPRGVINDTYFPGLKILRSSENKLPGIPHTLSLSSLEQLYMQRNTYDLSWTTEFQIPASIFDQLPNLTHLDLSGNKLHKLKRGTFSNANSLLFLYLSNTQLDEVEELVFESSYNLWYLDMSLNDFASKRNISRNVFKGLSNLRALDLSQCRISTFYDRDLFIHLENLKYISLRQNDIVELYAIFEHNPCLVHVDLQRNKIAPWDYRIFKQNSILRNISLGSNQVTRLTEAMLDDFDGKPVVELNENPLRCDCQLIVTVREYISSRNKHLHDLPLNGTMNKCNFNDGLLKEYLEKHVNSEECKQLSTGMILLISFVAILFTSLAIFLIIYNFKWQIMYHYYVFKEKIGLMQFPLMKRRKSVGGEYKYDAFVSYSHEDSKFVKVMVAILEGEFKLRLCVFERDFKIGEVISSVVMESVAASRVTLLVLSEAFVKSQWCLWELQFAHHRAAFFRKARPDSLVVLKLDEIDQQLLTPNLAFLIKTRIYLQWDSHPNKQKVLWHQLKNAILQS